MAQVGALLAGSGASTLTQLVAVLTAASLGSAALLWIAFDARLSRVSVAWVFGLAVVLRLVAVQTDPLLEDDHFRYLWDGMRTAQHFNAYRLAPSAFFGDASLSPQWQDILSGINNPTVPTIYGPVLQALFALAHVLAPGNIGAVQGLLLLIDLACLALLTWQRVGTRWLLVYALHPMVLKEAMASAHPDGLVALWLLLALLLWQRKTPCLTGAMLGLAVATKVAAVVVVPLFLFAQLRGRGDRRAATKVAFSFVLALTLIYLPFVGSGASEAAGLTAFATQWRFNPLLYRLIEAAVPQALARPATAVLITAGIAGLVWHQACRKFDVFNNPGPAVASALLWLLLLSPVVNPWYGLWALGPAVAARQPSVAAWSCVSVLAYLNGAVLPQTAAWSEGTPAAFAVAWPIAGVQLAVMLGAAGWAYFSTRKPANAAHRK